MKFLFNYSSFMEEVRLSDIVNIKGTGLTYSNVTDTCKFLKFKTISNRINNNRIRLNISWYDNNHHNLTRRLKERTNLKSIGELNSLLSKGLDEIYKDDDFCDGLYSLWFSEYNFSIIINKDNKDIFVKTILQGRRKTDKLGKTIELKSTL